MQHENVEVLFLNNCHSESVENKTCGRNFQAVQNLTKSRVRSSAGKMLKRNSLNETFPHSASYFLCEQKVSKKSSRGYFALVISRFNPIGITRSQAHSNKCRFPIVSPRNVLVQNISSNGGNFNYLNF